LKLKTRVSIGENPYEYEEHDSMKSTIRRAAVLACAAVFTAGCNSAFARPSHHYHHHRHQRVLERAPSVNPYYGGPGSTKRYGFEDESGLTHAPAMLFRRHARMRMHRAPVASVATFGGGSSLVADARRYIGTNPTGRRSLWCGAFMDKVLRDTGHRGGGNLAKGYLNYGHRIAGPRVGAIAVMGRRGGGHVGVVSGVDANGNPIIISGNHNHTVAESTYSRSRIIAYVMPGG
jgi:uncharacterized protein (TIGR02594 family)